MVQRGQYSGHRLHVYTPTPLSIHQPHNVEFRSDYETDHGEGWFTSLTLPLRWIGKTNFCHARDVLVIWNDRGIYFCLLYLS
jgi:hypothetical protein